MIASGSLVSRMQPLNICLRARQRAIGKQTPYVGSVACSVWRKDRAFNRKHCDVHHIRHHCAPPGHGSLGAISQPPLAGEPQKKGRCTRHIYPWALSTVLMKVVLEGATPQAIYLNISSDAAIGVSHNFFDGSPASMSLGRMLSRELGVPGGKSI